MDGVGWMLEKGCRLMRCYGWTWDYVQFEITSAQGWCFYNWALESEMTAFGAIAEVKGDNFIAQERKAILERMNHG